MGHKNRNLKIYPKKNDTTWTISGMCDRYFGGDTDSRISVGGYVVYFMGVTISWISKAQGHVTLSSTEAEYVSISEVVKELHFVEKVLSSIGIMVDTPIEVICDNIGEIFWPKIVKQEVSQGTLISIITT